MTLRVSPCGADKSSQLTVIFSSLVLRLQEIIYNLSDV